MSLDPRPRSPHLTGACGITEAHSDEDHAGCNAHRGDPQTWCASCRSAAAVAESLRRIRERRSDQEISLLIRQRR